MGIRITSDDRAAFTAHARREAIGHIQWWFDSTKESGCDETDPRFRGGHYLRGVPSRRFVPGDEPSGLGLWLESAAGRCTRGTGKRRRNLDVDDFSGRQLAALRDLYLLHFHTEVTAMQRHYFRKEYIALEQAGGEAVDAILGACARIIRDAQESGDQYGCMATSRRHYRYALKGMRQAMREVRRFRGMGWGVEEKHFGSAPSKSVLIECALSLAPSNSPEEV